MKYTILINQKAIIEQNLGVDIVDATILHFIYDYSASPHCRRMAEGALLYIWISPKLICEQLPILKMKPDSVYRRLKILADMGFMIRHPENVKTGSCWYAITALLADMYFEKEEKQSVQVTAVPPPKPETAPDPNAQQTSTVILKGSFNSDPSDIDIRPLGISSSDPSELANKQAPDPSDSDTRPLGSSSDNNTIVNNTIVNSSVVVNAHTHTHEAEPYDDDPTPEFVRQHRQQMAQYRDDRTPPVNEEEIWCKVDNKGYSKESLRKQIKLWLGGQKGEIFQRDTGYSVDQVLDSFIEHRAMNDSFRSPRYLIGAMEYHCRDLKAGRIKLLPTDQSNQSTHDFGDYEYR